MTNASALSEKKPPLALSFKHNVHNNVAPDAAELASKQGNGLHNIGM